MALTLDFGSMFPKSADGCVAVADGHLNWTQREIFRGFKYSRSPSKEISCIKSIKYVNVSGVNSESPNEFRGPSLQRESKNTVTLVRPIGASPPATYELACTRDTRTASA